MLFSSEDIESTKEEQLKPSAASAKVVNRFALGKSNDLLPDLIPSLEKDTAIHLPSFGNWSFNHLLAHCLSLTGTAKVYLTSWTISEQPVKEILQLLDGGVIEDLYCLLDSRVKQQCPNAYQIAQHRFANLKLCHIHAKIAVIVNDEWQLTINSSANLSRNPKIEAYVVTESKVIAEHHREWILQQLNNAYPFQK